MFLIEREVSGCSAVLGYVLFISLLCMNLIYEIFTTLYFFFIFFSSFRQCFRISYL